MGWDSWEHPCLGQESAHRCTTTATATAAPGLPVKGKADVCGWEAAGTCPFSGILKKKAPRSLCP